MKIKSPYRWAGGKANQLHILFPLLKPLIDKTQNYCEPFVGGGSVVLEVAEQYPNISLFINDKNYNLYCFWKYISEENNFNELFNLINQTATLDLFYKLKTDTSTDILFSAYKSIFLNRTSFNGMGKNPIGGKEQKSKYTVDCRYNSKDIKNKILLCNELLKNRTTVSNEDVIDYLKDKNDLTYYIDAPYYLKGKELYQEWMQPQEHENLSKLLKLKDNFVISYDNCDEIKKLYSDINYFSTQEIQVRYSINGKKNNWKDNSELIITRANKTI